MGKAKKLEATGTEPHKRLDLDELRMRFHRLLSNRYRRWRFCTEPQCRRERTCMGDPTTCSSDGRPKPVRTPEENAKIMADLYKDLKRLSEEKRAQAEMAAIAAQQAAPQPAASRRPRRDSARASR